MNWKSNITQLLCGALLFWAASNGSAQTAATNDCMLNESDLLPMLTRALQPQYEKQGEVELRLSRPWTPVRVPAGDLSLRITEMPTIGLSPSFIARFELISTNGNAVGSWQAVLQAKLWREVWVARSVLTRGATLNEEDVVMDRRDVLTCREPLAEGELAFGEIEVAYPVNAGMPLPARAIKPRVLIRRGQMISARVEDGALAITLKVEAAEDGARGQIIKVRNPVSRRDLRAVVLGESSVRISS
jgi:flagella basal body P-ring formation protein FlgA